LLGSGALRRVICHLQLDLEVTRSTAVLSCGIVIRFGIGISLSDPSEDKFKRQYPNNAKGNIHYEFKPKRRSVKKIQDGHDGNYVKRHPDQQDHQ